MVQWLLHQQEAYPKAPPYTYPAGTLATLKMTLVICAVSQRGGGGGGGGGGWVPPALVHFPGGKK